MPTTFLDRERAFEAKFAHDEELRFLALARRDKLFGRWAATTLKSSKEEGDALVKTVLTIADGPGHDLALLGYIADRLSARGWGFEGSLPEGSRSLHARRARAARREASRVFQSALNHSGFFPRPRAFSKRFVARFYRGKEKDDDLSEVRQNRLPRSIGSNLRVLLPGGNVILLTLD